MRRLVLAAALASAIVGTGCASGGSRAASAPPSPPPPPFYEPEIALRDVRFAGAGLTGGVMDVVLRVYNPNDYAIRSPRVAYRVMVDRHELSEGAYDSDVEVPAGDSAAVLVPVRVGYATAALASRALMGDGTVNYRVLGRIHVSTPHGRRSAPYDRFGRFAPLTAAISRASR